MPRRNLRASIGLCSKLLLAVVALAGSTACSSTNDLTQQCSEARSRVASARVDLLGEAPSDQLARDYEQHRKHFESALGDSFIASCKKKGSGFADCILDATTPNAVLDCTRDDDAKQALRDSARKASQR